MQNNCKNHEGATPEQGGQTASFNMIDDQQIYYFLHKTDDTYHTLFIGWMSEELMKALLILEPGCSAIVNLTIGEVTVGAVFDGPVYLLKYGNLEALVHAGDDRKLDIFPSGNVPESEDCEHIFDYPTYWTKDVEPLLDWKMGGKLFHQVNGQWIEVPVQAAENEGDKQEKTDAVTHSETTALNECGARGTEPGNTGEPIDLNAQLGEAQPLAHADEHSPVSSGGKENGMTSIRPAWVFNTDTGGFSMQQVNLPGDGIGIEASGPLPPGCQQAELFKIEPNGHKFKVGETRTLSGLVGGTEEYNGQQVEITAIRKDGERGKAYYIKGKINEKCNWVHEDRLV